MPTGKSKVMDKDHALEAIKIIAESSLDIFDVEILHARLREIIEITSAAFEPKGE